MTIFVHTVIQSSIIRKFTSFDIKYHVTLNTIVSLVLFFGCLKLYIRFVLCLSLFVVSMGPWRSFMRYCAFNGSIR